MTTPVFVTNSFPRSKSYANRDWDYDDVNSVHYDFANTVKGDLKAEQRIASAGPATKVKSVGTGTFCKDLSASIVATTEKTSPTTEESTSTNSNPDLADPAVPALHTTTTRKLSEEAELLLSPFGLTIGAGDNATNEAYELARAKSTVSSTSIPRELEIPSVIYGTLALGRRRCSQKQKAAHDARAAYDYSLEESAMPLIPGQQELEDLYEQLRRENCPSQEELAQRYLYLQQQQQRYLHKMHAQDQHQPNKEERIRRRRNGRRSCLSSSSSCAKKESRGRSSVAAGRLLSKSCNDAAGTEQAVRDRAIELGLDDELQSTHSRSVRSRSRSRLLKRRASSSCGPGDRDDEDGVEDSGVLKEPSNTNTDVVVDNKQDGVELIVLDDAPYKANGKRRNVLWGFFVASWKLCTFQWFINDVRRTGQAEGGAPEIESDDDCSYYCSNQRRRQQERSLPGGIGYARRGSF